MKRFTKLIISIIYISMLTFKNALIMFFRSIPPSSFLVVTYHSVHTDQIDKFIQHILFSREVGVHVHPDIDGPLIQGRRHIAMTFDDGFENYYYNALPLLIEYKIPSTVFVPTGFIGSKQGWIKEKNNRNYEENIMSQNQIADLPPDFVKIGSHGVSHLPFDKMNNEGILIELSESKQVLDQILGRETRLLALPHGAYIDGIEDMSDKTGYDRVFLNVPISSSTKFGNRSAGRIDITLDDWPIEYKLKYLGAYQWQRYYFRIKDILKTI